VTRGIPFPGGKSFAFTILDDTDDTTVENGRPIYSLLKELGLRTTKTVWALDTPRGEQGPYFAAETLQNEQYRAWVHELAADGFEIAFHNASMGTSHREKTIEALDFLAQEFEGAPRLHCNHGQNRENLHWGASRYSTFELGMVARAVERVRGGRTYEGHEPGSPYYWEDVCAERIEYVRRLAFLRLNCATIPPGRPFHDPRKPGIPLWFNTADAANVTVFTDLVTREAIDELEASGGWAIVSTHLGKGFVREGRVDPSVRKILEDLADRPGWFVPASPMLDHIRTHSGDGPLEGRAMRRMEYAHVRDRVSARLTDRSSPKTPS